MKFSRQNLVGANIAIVTTRSVFCLKVKLVLFKKTKLKSESFLSFPFSLKNSGGIL